MRVTLEISMYPFNENYLDPIVSFIEKLNQYANLRISTSATSTVVVGEFQHVMQTLGEMLEWSYAKHGKAVFVTKIIPGHDPDNV